MQSVAKIGSYSNEEMSWRRQRDVFNENNIIVEKWYVVG